MYGYVEVKQLPIDEPKVDSETNYDIVFALKQLENFPFDETKGIDYYLDRYYTEPKYKIWFDENYPNLTIEEAVRLVEYSLLPSFQYPYYQQAKITKKIPNLSY